MRIFETGPKVNFVDQNNTVLGFDTEQQCSEKACWWIASSPNAEEEHHTNLQDYVFDVKTPPVKQPSKVSFRITNGLTERWVVLQNIHEGWYHHGFVVEVGGVPIIKGEI